MQREKPRQSTESPSGSKEGRASCYGCSLHKLFTQWDPKGKPTVRECGLTWVSKKARCGVAPVTQSCGQDWRMSQNYRTLSSLLRDGCTGLSLLWPLVLSGFMTPHQCSTAPAGYSSKEHKNTNSKRYMHSYVYCWIVYNNQGMEATSVSINRWMDKEEWYII